MVSPLEGYQQCQGKPWLQSPQDITPAFNAAFDKRYPRLADGDRPTLLLAESNPATFLGSFLAACAARCPVFLANPKWAAAEWQQAVAIAQPDLIWRDGQETPCSPRVGATRPRPGWIMIPTGGSSGKLKFAIHTWDTLAASVQGFRDYFALERVNAYCTLPLYHVSGLMQFLRSLHSGGQLILQPWRALAQTLPVDPEAYFLSLVPAQLQALLDQPAAVANLRRFQTILLGGAPAWGTLLGQGRSQRLPLAPTYGMTETASQVATLKPADFLAGHQGCGHPLPHAQVAVVDERGQPAAQGRLQISARSLYLGYYPQATYPAHLLADDLGQFNGQGLQILGRQSDKIISGGENIFPAEVEAAIRAANLVADVAVVGAADPQWGETPVALYVAKPNTSPPTSTALASHLTRYKHPSRWIAVEHLPRSPQGKLDRQVLKAIALRAIEGVSAPLPPLGPDLQGWP